MSDSNEKLVLQELKRISRLLALNLIADKTLQGEKIEMLDQYGFQPREIADLLKTKPEIVHSFLYQIRKKPKTKKVSKSKKVEVSKLSDKQGT